MRPTTSDNENDLASSPIRGPASVLGGASGGVTTAGINPGKRRHVSVGGQSCSPGSANGGEEVEGQEEKRKHPVKRACNECRQQKMSPSQAGLQDRIELQTDWETEQECGDGT
ncbi:hypothetical protein CISG_08273 [Coccidioides immitis RMSCC 3703]|uniref:Uncharacterized protein n=1 Tax=Coccidioides immitis RMSCC 3703 TaxID=454286 RepID=A0A0J8R6V8_COCIT|nr:hypothetical protein CISG_08273 [Coccidioides immitis RMSCC 3703]